MTSKEMKFKDFKKVVIAYAAAKGMIKEKQIKKIMKFECKKNESVYGSQKGQIQKEDVYLAYFKYAGRDMKLKYISANWYLFIDGPTRSNFLKTGLTINKCCDFLWENKTPENIQKNWYI